MRCWLACAALLASTAHAQLMHPLFSDHVVLQRDQPINVWGRARPGERVEVSIEQSRVTAPTDDNGQWFVTLPALKAGGPYVLTATAASGATQRVSDVLMGDVWLCSGQSNMVLQVHRALDARSEIANASNESIRLLTIPLASHAQPQTQFAGEIEWQPVSSKTIAEFSAACWYFARELQKSVNVPMGLIAAAWGGSKIEAWTSASALRAHGGFDEGLDILERSVTDPWRAFAQWGGVWETWWRSRATTTPWSMTDRGDWRVAPKELGPWEAWGDARLASYNGMVWYRTSITLSAAQAAQGSTLSLGQVDEVDQTWVNGQAIGARANATVTKAERALAVLGSGADRTYRLPRGTLIAGENVIVVNVLDTYAVGGLRGPASKRVLRLEDGTEVELDREWRYQIASSMGSPPRAPWESVAGLGVIFNAMIAPLTRLPVRGVAWYQGESNADESSRYGTLLQAFIADWRQQFGRPTLPFLIVQLPNYGAPPTAPTASGWADLREHQRRVVAADEHAALVVAIDLGERTDIHPANKQDVGRRLARAARNVVFGESIAPSGPRIRDARRAGDRIILSFDDVSGALVAYSAAQPIGFELCGRDQASCRFAPARVAGARVELTVNEPNSTQRVRYCWADSPVCTLYDESPLPAGPFEIEVDR